MLWSVNERLGLLCRRHGYEGEVPGLDMPRLGTDWLDEVLGCALSEKEALDELED